MHVRDTTRSEAREQAEVEPRNVLQQRPINQSNQQSSNRGPRELNREPNNQSFLDCFKEMQEQISQVTSKLQQLDVNYRSLCNQQPAYPMHYQFPVMQPQIMKPPILQPAMGESTTHAHQVMGSPHCLQTSQ